ncbi:MAG: 30S ribosome-binding factor RbfA [Vicinamibacterales bacterium]|jgi:ribosome-binding factor A|nr:ribosome-binding factor A [Acidobacteriota bacterium]MDP6373578.1 30S ribosome-binding factor RbfA [Vicinamibacterales bacterium]MDP6609130.1 30S ribosome-binding factor RbfA [Vicinamibacterales bacterium]HAK54109.1 30S ribosome-binding factor RbfA [Acidobacteriota bacterium]|tara:strand:- start:4652 stop:5065 length:414 start_codon:yes stop_codon:yes gene_type:complete
MAQGSRPDRVADLVRAELSELLARHVKDPGVGFVTLTRVRVTPDLQQAHVYYTTLGDDAQRRQSSRALQRAGSFLRHQIGRRLRLKRTPALTFHFDESIGHQVRVEQLLEELQIEPEPAADEGDGGVNPESGHDEDE